MTDNVVVKEGLMMSLAQAGLCRSISVEVLGETDLN